MSIPQTQIQLLQAIDKNFTTLANYLAHIPKEKAAEKNLPGHAQGTVMSVRDLVCYLLGWNELVLKWITLDKAQTPVDLPETGFKWNQLGQLAQKFYGDYPSRDFTSLLADLHEVKQKIMVQIATSDDEALYGRPWYGKWTLGRMISLNTSSPYANACVRLRRWAKEQNIPLK
ncbi:MULTISPECIES: ClbS/DfsB family four-helix bundle protein [Klebsiella/Raoultella group]|uniref:ClbS/DfsB family four-helix bundle protein n=1 Tax=Raoultella lignicola TaxID=3040939 RepID=A0ABU9FA05_9ENTR|nr:MULTISPECIES: ClbS/DfsB family four-helix bundle protein [Klebsiella/Raoultella group]MRT48546.1 ClbS/DfsB family four-helix bundle protein [Raoultella sp. RIT712]